MKTKWKIIIPVLIVAALAAAFFLQGDDTKNAAEPVGVGSEAETVDPVNVDVEPVAPVAVDMEAVEVVVDTSGDLVATEPVVTSGDLTVVSVPMEATGNLAIYPETQAPVEPVAPEEPVMTEPVTTVEVVASIEPVEPEPVATEPEPAEVPMEVTISISCAKINDNIGDLDPAKTGLVPADGWILRATKVELNEGESVFNVLQRVCKQNKIHMEFMNTPVYNSAYIEGINNLYEFDCGPLSGWMYCVNDWYPNYGSSRYELKPGDVICWRYTCDLGADIGGGYVDNGQKDD